MTTTTGKERILISDGAKLEEELKDEIVEKDTISTTEHIKRHHLVHGIWSKHLNNTTMLL